MMDFKPETTGCWWLVEIEPWASQGLVHQFVSRVVGWMVDTEDGTVVPVCRGDVGTTSLDEDWADGRMTSMQIPVKRKLIWANDMLDAAISLRADCPGCSSYSLDEIADHDAVLQSHDRTCSVWSDMEGFL